MIDGFGSFLSFRGKSEYNSAADYHIILQGHGKREQVQIVKVEMTLNVSVLLVFTLTQLQKCKNL